MISRQEMLEAEAQSGIPVSVLMENAGKAIAKAIKEKTDIKNKRILIVCHHGNNGGDGFAAATFLCEEAEVAVLFTGEEDRLKPEAMSFYQKAENNYNIQFLELDHIDFNEYDIIVDALLGSGIQGSLKPTIASVIESINTTKAMKFSVDIPSGLDPDTGEDHDKVVEPDVIIALHDIKKGASTLQDKTVIVDIGISKQP